VRRDEVLDRSVIRLVDERILGEPQVRQAHGATVGRAG
jgi:hypothetical protein